MSEVYMPTVYMPLVYIIYRGLLLDPRSENRLSGIVYPFNRPNRLKRYKAIISLILIYADKNFDAL